MTNTAAPGILGLTGTQASGAALATAANIPMVEAATAHSFTDSIGVNAHIDSGASNWENTALVKSEILYLGVNHVRDGTPYDWALNEYVALAKLGVKFDLSQVNPVAAPFTTVGAAQDVQRADTLQLAVPGSVQSLEGANEYNDNSYDLNGLNSYGNMAWGALDDQNLQAAVAADRTLAGVKVVGASAETVTSVPIVAPYVDASNWHVYGDPGEQLGANLAAGIAGAQASAPGKPVYITETGISSSGYGSSFWGVTDEATQGLIDTNALLDSYKDGAAQTFLYDLMDEAGASSQNNDFGLFHANGTPKLAATDLRNLMSVLADTGTSVNPPGALHYAISGLPSTASSMLLERSDGAFDIVIWNSGAVVSNGAADVTPSSANVVVTFASTSPRIDVYDPVSGASPMQSAVAANAVSFNLAADPVILQVQPNQAAALVLSLSEDAYIGDAQFSVSVDGVQIGGAQTVTALHGQKQTQAIVVPGSFTDGQHTVAVSFLNDAWGGTVTTDRNLYVDNITLGGATANIGAELYADGTQTFVVSSAAPGTGPVSIGNGLDSILLDISEDAWRRDAQFTVSVDGAQTGGVQTATASHAAGADQAFTIHGSFAASQHTVTVNFLNDAYGGSPSMDRNLYVDSETFNGSTKDVGAVLFGNEPQSFIVGAPSNVTQAVSLGAGVDSMVLAISEDASLGDAKFIVSIDGTQIGGTQTATASHAAGLDEVFRIAGNFALGVHDVAVAFLNDAYGGSPSMDRNLYVDRISYGATTTAVQTELYNTGTQHFAVSTAAASRGTL